MHICITVKKCQTNMESTWDFVKCGIIFLRLTIPKDGRDIELGFNDENEFPHDFKQEIYPLKKK
jgi:hypothetical protein